MVDASGREIRPPASLLVFAIAPDKRVGWTRAGRGNTANIEVVLQAKTDLIVDVGSTSASLASLATQVQELDSLLGEPGVLPR